MVSRRNLEGSNPQENIWSCVKTRCCRFRYPPLLDVLTASPGYIGQLLRPKEPFLCSSADILELLCLCEALRCIGRMSPGSVPERCWATGGWRRFLLSIERGGISAALSAKVQGPGMYHNREFMKREQVSSLYNVVSGDGTTTRVRGTRASPHSTCFGLFSKNVWRRGWGKGWAQGKGRSTGCTDQGIFVEWLGLGRDGPGIFGSQALRPARGT